MLPAGDRRGRAPRPGGREPPHGIGLRGHRTDDRSLTAASGERDAGWLRGPPRERLAEAVRPPPRSRAWATHRQGSLGRRPRPVVPHLRRASRDVAATRRGLPFVLTFHGGGHSSRTRQLLRGTQRAALRPLLA